ncbi:MAG: NAD(P)/FAD-dependent oxidoreductase, partial [Archaeoglobaceae archaeon]
MTEGVYLKDIGCDVTLVTRKVKPGSEKVLEEKFEEKEIPYIGRSRVLKIEGSDKVERVVLQNIETGEEQTVETDAVFIAIGKKPQTDFLASIGVDMDSRGYVKVDRYQRTNIEGVFAAGDCCDNPLKQIVTACGDGAVAAHSAYRYIKLGQS